MKFRNINIATNNLEFQKLVIHETQLLIRFNGTNNQTRLWLIQLYRDYLDGNFSNFTLLCIDNWLGTLGAFRADIASDLRDYLPDHFIDSFLNHIFYCYQEETQYLNLIKQLKEQKYLESEVIVTFSNENSYDLPLTLHPIDINESIKNLY